MQISYYDISRGVYDLAGRIKVSGTMGVPLCLSSAVDEKTEQENIIYGDDSGAVIMLQCGRGDLPARALKAGDYQVVHDDHTDWVTQVGHCVTVHDLYVKWVRETLHDNHASWVSLTEHFSLLCESLQCDKQADWEIQVLRFSLSILHALPNFGLLLLTSMMLSICLMTPIIQLHACVPESVQ